MSDWYSIWLSIGKSMIITRRFQFNLHRINITIIAAMVVWCRHTLQNILCPLQLKFTPHDYESKYMHNRVLITIHTPQLKSLCSPRAKYNTYTYQLKITIPLLMNNSSLRSNFIDLSEIMQLSYIVGMVMEGRGQVLLRSNCLLLGDNLLRKANGNR